ncbi:MAG TPA: PilZ domain-containing protein [Candidatus Acidoferrales bacterium]|nr:PilZ domain-containing protein [Candidatus Acidoferrales bacterium]
MVWLDRDSPPLRERGNQRRYYRQSIELPVGVTVRGLPAPVYGTLINISEAGCRLRSLILLDRNRIVEFLLNCSDGKELALRGRILSRTTPQSEAGFEYGIVFEGSAPADRDALAREIAHMQRRAAAARVTAREAAKYAAGGGRQRRSSVRAFVTFPVRYRINNRSAANGEASDVSAGGLRLICQEPLEIGCEAELRFTLPSGVLNVYPPPEERLEITPFGERRIRVPDNRRPFAEMLLRARVLTQHEPLGGRDVYGVGFVDIDGYQREEIARFTHAVQLSQIRGPG